MTGRSDVDDDERLMDLRGFLLRELQRAIDAGADEADLLASLAAVSGEVQAAFSPEQSANQFVVKTAVVGRLVRDNFERAVLRRANDPMARPRRLL